MTERLLLRLPDNNDVDAIVSIVGDWEVASRLARVPHPYGSADARFFLEQIVPTEWVWAVTLHGADDLVGVVSLTPEYATNAAELGYWLSPRQWGAGIATEAAKAVLQFGLEKLDLNHLTSGYFEDNPASGRVLEKLGFVFVGRESRSCLATGRETPSVRMKLSRSGSAYTMMSVRKGPYVQSRIDPCSSATLSAPAHRGSPFVQNMSAVG